MVNRIRLLHPELQQHQNRSILLILHNSTVTTLYTATHHSSVSIASSSSSIGHQSRPEAEHSTRRQQHKKKRAIGPRSPPAPVKTTKIRRDSDAPSPIDLIDSSLLLLKRYPSRLSRGSDGPSVAIVETIEFKLILEFIKFINSNRYVPPELVL